MLRAFLFLLLSWRSFLFLFFVKHRGRSCASQSCMQQRQPAFAPYAMKIFFKDVNWEKKCTGALRCLELALGDQCLLARQVSELLYILYLPAASPPPHTCAPSIWAVFKLAFQRASKRQHYWCSNSLSPPPSRACRGDFISVETGTELSVLCLSELVVSACCRLAAVLRVIWNKSLHILTQPALPLSLTSNVLFLEMKCFGFFSPVDFTSCCFPLALRACPALFLRRDNDFKFVFLFCVPRHMSNGSN